ncbi:MAG: hypothetical protein NWE90_03875 [Candidatus Bathyarchaeota archaeon]|nr:hypothetical protein [Candidatus Bathyarchaeota archaeon]
MLFPTQEIGSIARPNWLIKKLRGASLKNGDLDELNHWIKFSSFEKPKELKDILKKERIDEEDKNKLRDLSSLLVIRCFEKVGLDIVYDGEQHRTEMYQEPISNINGFKFYGEVRSFDNKYYKKAACIEEPELKNPYHVDEFNYIKELTDKPIKVPLTGAYTFTNWSFNEYFLKKWIGKERSRKKAIYKADYDLAMSLAKNVIRPNILALKDIGAKLIQIDEPAATTEPEEIDIFLDSYSESTKGINGCKFSLHICYSDYSLLYPHILKLENCSQYTFEFAQSDSYDFLELMRKYKDEREVGLGVIDSHSDKIESPELIRDRILSASKIIKPERIYVNPDCGLRTRSWKVAFRKLENMIIGASLARKALS